jgi:hypothetical protein
MTRDIMDTLVPWKRKLDEYHEEDDEDTIGINGPRLVNSMQECNFIMRDETNAKAMHILKSNWIKHKESKEEKAKWW